MVPSPMTRAIHELKRAALHGNAESFSDGELLDCFLARRDESAFAVLVRRHGPMVLGVCRRILGDVPDVDDAFQATFLVLLRKGDSIRPRDQVGAWLHGVARRVASKAKGLVARQHQREGPMVDWPAEPVPSYEQRDWLPLLDRELDRLPEKYRAVVVLCDLQGQSRREAAMKLRLSEGTLSSRLARARALLGDRLARRGVTLSAALLAFSQSASAAAPPALFSATHATIAAATSGTSIAASVSILSQGVLQAMFISKIVKTIAVVLVVVGFGMGLGTGYFLHVAYADKPAKPAADANKPAADKPTKPQLGDALVGQVLAVDASKKTLSLRVQVQRTKETKEETLNLANDVAVVLAHGLKKETKPGKIDDVLAEDMVSVVLTADKKAVASITVRAPSLNGVLKAVDAAKKTITLLVKNPKEKQGIEKTIELGEDAKVLVNDGLGTKTEPVPAKEVKLGDLAEGLVVSVQLSGYDRAKAVGVSATGPSVQGSVKAVDAANNTITIGMKGEADRTLPVAKNVKVAGKSKLADIAAGTNASLRLSVEDLKTVVAIFVKE